LIVEDILYIAFLEQADYKNMDGMSEFVIMAATLLEIKSNMLLPKQKETEYQKIILPKKPNYYHISIPMPKRIIFFIKQILSQN